MRCMTRLLIIAAVVAIAVLAVRHPAPAPPALAAAATPGFHNRAGAFGAKHTAIVVYVVGAVKRAGLYTLRDGSRVDDAVRSAGGLASDADPAGSNLAQRLRDGDEVDVPRLGETVRPRAGASSMRAKRHRKSDTAQPVSVDINHADALTIATLPSVGPALAQRIVAYREMNGPFVSLDELGDVAGMTNARIDAVTPYVILH